MHMGVAVPSLVIPTTYAKSLKFNQRALTFDQWLHAARAYQVPTIYLKANIQLLIGVAGPLQY